MKQTISNSFLVVLSLAVSMFLGTSAIYAGEVTIPSQMSWVVKPELAARYVYTEDGEFTKKLNIPTYEWTCAECRPTAIILGIHGLTLHGRRFRIIARTMAVQGYGFVSLDMRGFGKCKFDENKQFSTKDDDKTKINHEKSYEDIVALARLIREKYPDIPIIAMGESLGCTFCVKLAAEHHDLVDGMILCGPAVRVNPAMYASAKDIEQGLKAIFSIKHMVSLKQFISHLVSGRQEVVDEMFEDPLILKELSLGDLIRTDEFVEKTTKFGQSVPEDIPVLILQGGEDRCVSPRAVTDLMKSMPSCNQILAWMGHFGHLQLETSYFRSKVIDVIGDWIENRTPDARKELKQLESDVNDLGGRLVTEHEAAEPK